MKHESQIDRQHSQPLDADFDVVVIGGGPGGATAARQLALNGFRVIVLEQKQHPRFHIGESFLPRNFALIKQLGLLERLRQMPHTRKLGAEFIMGHGGEAGTPIWFTQQIGEGETEAFNIERAPFDAMLLDAAVDAGAIIMQNAPVKRIVNLEHDDVCVALDDGRKIRGRCLVDASGQSTIVGRHLRTRAVLPHLRKVAYFGHFTGVKRLTGDMDGFITIVMCSEGWFWLIPLDEHRTSIGLVMDMEKAKAADAPANQMLRWGIARCPVLRERTAIAVFPDENFVTADFSYRCAPFAGPGCFMVGDAATFMDPIFSTGVCLAMMGGVEAAKSIAELLRQPLNPKTHKAVQKRYCKFVDGSSSVFFWLVGNYYNHSFRELFLNGRGPFNVHGAVIGILSGHVFPRPSFAMRWRLKLFELCMRINRWIALVPRRASFSLLEQQPVDHPCVPAQLAQVEMKPARHSTESERARMATHGQGNS